MGAAMKLRAKLMIRFNKKLIKPGETFEAPPSQGLTMIKNGFALELKDKSEEKPAAKEEKPVKNKAKK